MEKLSNSTLILHPRGITLNLVSTSTMSTKSLEDFIDNKFDKLNMSRRGSKTVPVSSISSVSPKQKQKHKQSQEQMDCSFYTPRAPSNEKKRKRKTQSSDGVASLPGNALDPDVNTLSNASDDDQNTQDVFESDLPELPRLTDNKTVSQY